MSHSFDGQSSLSPQNVSTTVYKRRFPRVGLEFYSRLYDKLTKSHECLPEGEECTPCIELATGFRGTLIESDRRTCGWPRPTCVCCMEAVRKRTREFHVLSRTRPMGCRRYHGTTTTLFIVQIESLGGAWNETASRTRR